MHFLSWLAGVIGLVIIIWYFRSIQFGEQLRTIGVLGLAGWLAATMSARLIQVEIAVTSIAALGFSLRRLDAFWIGWIRTFANQILPLSGLAVFAYHVRQKSGIPWAELTALSRPMLFYASAALGLLGMVVASVSLLQGSFDVVPMLVGFASLIVVALLLSGWSIKLLGAAMGSKSTVAAQITGAFNKLSGRPGLTVVLILMNVVVLLFRGSRILLMFMVIGVDLNLADALLLIVISETTMIIQLTPGGLGVREGAIIGAAVLVGISMEDAATIALADRLLVAGITSVLAFPAYLFLRRSSVAGAPSAY